VFFGGDKRQPEIGLRSQARLARAKINKNILVDNCNSPLPVLMVAGLKAFHTIVSQMFVAINREILKK